MSILLRIFLIVISSGFLFMVLRMVRHDRFMLKYAFLWVVLGVLGVLLAVFPNGAFWLSSVLGFEMPVNFVFLVTIVLVMGVSLVYGAALSSQATRIKTLVQEISMLKSRIDELDKGASESDDD